MERKIYRRRNRRKKKKRSDVSRRKGNRKISKTLNCKSCEIRRIGMGRRNRERVNEKKREKTEREGTEEAVREDQK